MKDSREDEDSDGEMIIGEGCGAFSRKRGIGDGLVVGGATIGGGRQRGRAKNERYERYVLQNTVLTTQCAVSLGIKSCSKDQQEDESRFDYTHTPTEGYDMFVSR